VRLRDFPEEELFLQGSAACQGCPGSAALRVAFKALGRETILCVIASCTSVLQSPFPVSAFNLPTLNMAFATGGATASGLTAAAGGENLARVSGDAQTSVVVALTHLMDSPTHRANILGHDYSEVGVAAITDADGVSIFVAIFIGR
jgi:pyruvate ferredoxin oxidoreductase beta subunit